MFRFKTTKQHQKWWAERKLNWDKDYTSTWNHPHRALLVSALKTFPWISLWDVGCGSGANIVRFVKEGFTDKQMGGSDINPDAIEAAKATIVGGRFHVEPSDDLLLSDKATDVVLSDACLIYTGPEKIEATLKEMIRVARGHILLCEFHSTNPLKRWILRLKTGYNAYNYKHLLEKLGCYDIQMVKITKEYWDGFPWDTWGYVILAKIAK